MPLLAQIRGRTSTKRALDGIRIAACLHVTSRTADLMRDAEGGQGRRRALRLQTPLSTQDDVAAALVARVQHLPCRQNKQRATTSTHTHVEPPSITVRRDDGRRRRR